MAHCNARCLRGPQCGSLAGRSALARRRVSTHGSRMRAVRWRSDAAKPGQPPCARAALSSHGLDWLGCAIAWRSAGMHRLSPWWARTSEDMASAGGGAFSKPFLVESCPVAPAPLALRLGPSRRSSAARLRCVDGSSLLSPMRAGWAHHTQRHAGTMAPFWAGTLKAQSKAL